MSDLLIGSSAATLADWLEGRVPTHLSTNSGATPVAFQAWRAFKEAFAPELVAQAFEETGFALGRAVERSIDPFGGSGTTALASQFLGVSPTTIEVNPYLADLIEAKLVTYNASALLDDYSNVLKNARSSEEGALFPGAPVTFVEPGLGGRYLFSLKIARKLAALRNAVLSVGNPDHRRLFRVLLAPVPWLLVMSSSAAKAGDIDGIGRSVRPMILRY